MCKIIQFLSETMFVPRKQKNKKNCKMENLGNQQMQTQDHLSTLLFVFPSVSCLYSFYRKQQLSLNLVFLFLHLFYIQFVYSFLLFIYSVLFYFPCIIIRSSRFCVLLSSLLSILLSYFSLFFLSFFLSNFLSFNPQHFPLQFKCTQHGKTLNFALRRKLSLDNLTSVSKEFYQNFLQLVSPLSQAG